MKAIGNRRTSARHLTRDYVRVFYLAEGLSNKAFQAYHLINNNNALIFIQDATLGNLMVTQICADGNIYLLYATTTSGVRREYSLQIIEDEFNLMKHAELKFVRVIKGDSTNSCFVIDLTSLGYPSSGREVVSELDKGNTITILFKVGEIIPMRQVVQIEVEDDVYRLYTGSYNAVETDTILELHQLCYTLNRADGTVVAKMHKLMGNIATVKTLENYINKIDNLLLDCGNSKT